MRVDELHHLIAICRVADDGDAMDAIQHHDQTRSYQRVVIDDRNPDGAAHHGLRGSATRR
jgi:hypothetical protein